MGTPLRIVTQIKSIRKIEYFTGVVKTGLNLKDRV
jgi:hypothetical protein